MLVIPKESCESIDLQELCKKYQDSFKDAIKQDGDRYVICKSFGIRNENLNTAFKEKCEINTKICFEYISFGEIDSKESLRIDFQHCEFRDKVYFTNCEFNGNVFFNHTTFCKYADFHESIFNGIVSFYNVTFKSAPNFSTCVFGKIQGVNFINVKINGLEFAEIKNFISEYRNDKTYKKEIKLSKEKQETIKKHKIRYANNARDSFRTIKNVLIANNNLIDASKWHKLELYAKEIELRLPEPKSENNANDKYKKIIDLIQLCFYRHTSAHHTDLLKILSWFVILVGAFATALFFEKNFFNKKILWSILLGSLSIVLCLSIIFDKIKFFVFLAISSYIPCIWLLTWNPKYIFGVANLFGNDNCQSDWFLNLLLSIYTMLFILVIFSLQKTARKNSIIPS